MKDLRGLMGNAGDESAQEPNQGAGGVEAIGLLLVDDVAGPEACSAFRATTGSDGHPGKVVVALSTACAFALSAKSYGCKEGDESRKKQPGAEAENHDRIPACMLVSHIRMAGVS